jgi:hypothetical protein
MKQRSLSSRGVFENHGRKSRREVSLDEKQVTVNVHLDARCWATAAIRAKPMPSRRPLRRHRT